MNNQTPNEIEVYFSLNSEFAGEIDCFLFQGDLEEAKRVAYKLDKRATDYTYKDESDGRKDTHFIDAEYYDGPNENFKNLQNYVGDL